MTQPIHYIGVDPGQNGGLAILSRLDGKTKVEWLRRMPDTEQDTWELFDNIPIGHALIEKVGSRPGQNSVSTFTFGRNTGLVIGFLVAAEIPFEEIRPQQWVQGLNIPSKSKTESHEDWKRRLKSIAQKMYPGLDITLKTADALLIATYCMRRSLTPLFDK